MLYYLLGPVFLAGAALLGWNLLKATRIGQIRSFEMVDRIQEPREFWFVVVFYSFAMLCFGFIGLFVSADMIGIV